MIGVVGENVGAVVASVYRAIDEAEVAGAEESARHVSLTGRPLAN